MARPSILASLDPQTVLRGGIWFSLVTMGAAMIYRVSHLGYQSGYDAELKETIGFLFVCACLFALFYWQNIWTGRRLKRELSKDLGSLQAWSCVAMLLFSMIDIWAHPRGLPQTLTTGTLIWMIVLIGEGLFTANVRQVIRRGQAAPQASNVRSLVPTPIAQITSRQGVDLSKWLRPSTPMRQFGTVAAFLIVIGILLQLLLSARLLVPWAGAIRTVPMGALWIVAGLIFGAFAGSYWLFGERDGRVYDKKLSNIHFGLMLVWLLDLVRLVFGWQSSLLLPMATLRPSDFAWEAGAIFAVCCVFFVLNLRTT